MRPLTILILGAVLFTLTPDPVHSQLSIEQETEATSSVPGTRSPVAAGFLEYIIPTAGFAYGGDWRRGLLPNALRIGGLVLVVSRSELGLFGTESECQTECKAGFVLAVVGSIWAIAGAVDTTNEFNDRLRAASAQVTISPFAGGGLSIGLRVFR
jgi:hypothetical protein